MLGHRVDQRVERLHLQVVAQVIAGTKPFQLHGGVKEFTGRKARHGRVDSDLELPELQAAPTRERVYGLGSVDPHGRAVARPGRKGADTADVIACLPVRQVAHSVLESPSSARVEARRTRWARSR